MEVKGTIIPEFKVYNRYQELARRERELKELAWEKELQLAMEASDPLSTQKVDSDCTMALAQTCSSCPKGHHALQKMSSSPPKLKKLRSCDSGLKEKNLGPMKKNISAELDIREHSQLNSQKEEPNTTIEGNDSGSDTLCDIQNKLQNLEFIDRSPSPVDRHKSA